MDKPAFSLCDSSRTKRQQSGSFTPEPKATVLSKNNLVEPQSGGSPVKAECCVARVFAKKTAGWMVSIVFLPLFLPPRFREGDGVVGTARVLRFFIFNSGELIIISFFCSERMATTMEKGILAPDVARTMTRKLQIISKDAGIPLVERIQAKGEPARAREGT